MMPLQPGTLEVATQEEPAWFQLEVRLVLEGEVVDFLGE